MRIYIVGLASQNLCTLLAAVPDSDIVGETAELAPSQEAIKTAKVDVNASLMLRFGGVRLWALCRPSRR